MQCIAADERYASGGAFNYPQLWDKRVPAAGVDQFHHQQEHEQRLAGYAEDQLIHSNVANAINGLTEFLRLERKQGSGRILCEADRLECFFFGGFDPDLEGDEPPGV